jgi:hypothetical protein
MEAQEDVYPGMEGAVWSNRWWTWLNMCLHFTSYVHNWDRGGLKEGAFTYC